LAFETGGFPMTDGAQDNRWVQFYEAAWATRAAYIQELMRQGETEPLRMIGSLNARERKYRLFFDAQSQQSVFERYQLKDGDILCPAGTPLMRTSSLAGKPLTVPFYTETLLYNYIIDYCDEHGPFDAIVELGCGYGQNLFKIYYHGGLKIPYFGGELSASGVSLAGQIASLEPKHSFTFFPFDHFKPDLKPLPAFGKILVFTMHSIEQVNRIGVSLFQTIAQAAKSVTCLHFEPFGFQVRELGEVTRYQKQGFAKNGWNENFYATLMAAAAQGVLKIDSVETEIFLSDRSNPTSLAIWHAIR
jgi:hypothetical protein